MFHSNRLWKLNQNITLTVLLFQGSKLSSDHYVLKLELDFPTLFAAAEIYEEKPTGLLLTYKKTKSIHQIQYTLDVRQFKVFFLFDRFKFY